MVTKESNQKGAFRALADPTRRDILVLLEKGALSVGEIAREFPVSRPAISKHLRILEQARLVSEVREGRRHVYQVDPGPLAEVSGWLELFEQAKGMPAKTKPAKSKPVAAKRARRAKPAAAPPQEEKVVAVEDDWKQW
jgi:DNA-binding transcriptional ArsR family regulator